MFRSFQFACLLCITAISCVSTTPDPTIDSEDALGASSSPDAGPLQKIECRESSECRSPDRPICANNTCVSCVDGAISACSKKDASAPLCDAKTGSCAACLADNDCPESQPVCSAGACTKCTDSAACAIRDPKKPICGGEGLCVECAQDSECSGGTPYCVENVCKACKDDAFCATKGGSNKVCADSGLCVECKTDGQCSIDKPACVSNQCSGCAANGAAPGACSVHNASKSVCDAARSSCVECVSSSDCKADPNKPICAANSCKPCASDSQCEGNGPGVCGLSTGKCLTETEVSIVDPAKCGAEGEGSSTKPYCQFASAFNGKEPKKGTIVVRGKVDGRLRYEGTQPLLVVGQSGAEFTRLEARSPSGKLSVRGVNFSGEDGIVPLPTVDQNCDGCDLDLQSLNIRGGDVGIELGRGRSALLRNVVVSGATGRRTSGGDTIKGVFIANVPNITLEFSTIVNEVSQSAVHCIAGASPSFQHSGNLINGQIGCAGFSRCCSDAVTGKGEIQAGSPCLDRVAQSPATPGFDLFGNARPSGTALDCGAHEFR